MSDVNGINNNDNSIKKPFGTNIFPSVTPKEIPNNDAAVVKKGEEKKENDFPFDLKDIVYPSNQEDFSLENYVLPKFKTKISADGIQDTSVNNHFQNTPKTSQENINFRDAVQNWNKIRIKAEKILESAYSDGNKPYLRYKPA